MLCCVSRTMILAFSDSPFFQVSGFGVHKDLLVKHGVTDVFPGLIPTSGLFSAAVVRANVAEANTAGYTSAWTRDNALVAHSLLMCGHTEAAARTARALASFYLRYEHRLDACIAGRANVDDENQRPHIRFNGTLVQENETGWPHKQNDACGYFMWVFAKLARARHLTPTDDELRVLGKFVRFLHKIQYWEDEDREGFIPRVLVAYIDMIVKTDPTLDWALPT
eukprot:5780959-Amphidinium_carterae.1